LEHGDKPWEDGRKVANYIFDEMVDESLMDNQEVIKLLNAFKELLQHDPEHANKNYFVYHQDTGLSTLAVSLLNFPYEESEHWKREFSQNTGFQKNLFEQSYEDFIRTLSPGNDEELYKFLKIGEDKTSEKVLSAVNYLKLRKIKRMLLENQVDMEKEHTPEELNVLRETHRHLKKMEMELTQALGTVVIR